MGIGGLHGINACASFGYSDGRWRWSIHPTKEGDALDIESRDDDDVALASDNLISDLEAFSLAVAAWPTISREAKRDYVEQLKKSGRALTVALFDRRDAEFVRELNTMDIRSVNILNRSKEQVLIDFCVLRDGDTEFFLGERCLCIYRMRNRDSGLLNKALAIKHIADEPLLVGYAEDGELNSSCVQHNSPRRPQIEEIYVAGAVAGGISRLAVLSPLTGAFTAMDKNCLITWLEDRRHVVHFNCHAEHNPHPPRLRVRTNALFGRPEIEPDRVDMTGTFVFLNACSSAIGGRSIRASLAEYFREQGAGCIACATGALERRATHALKALSPPHLTAPGIGPSIRLPNRSTEAGG